MLTARAYSFRSKSRLAISLSWVAGYTNVITFLLCGGVVVSHTTGNVTHLGAALGRGDFWNIAYFAFLFLTFLLGAMSSSLITELGRSRLPRSRYVAPIAVEAGLLALLAIGMRLCAGRNLEWTDALLHNRTALFGLTGLASFAMGLQNATITSVSGAVIRTTHLTGVTTDLGMEIVQFAFWCSARAKNGGKVRIARIFRVSQRHPSAQRILLLFCIIGSFLLGAILATWMFHLQVLALLVPIGFLLFVVYMDWRTPVADVRELDPLADEELSRAGLIRPLLPQELGVYRLAHHRHDRAHEAPDFQNWIDRLPARWKVVVLAISPMTRLDGNAFVSLAGAVRTLHEQGRDLVLCGTTVEQYRAILRSDLKRVLERENICPDMEFAIARGIGMLEELSASC